MGENIENNRMSKQEHFFEVCKRLIRSGNSNIFDIDIKEFPKAAEGVEDIREW